MHDLPEYPPQHNENNGPHFCLKYPHSPGSQLVSSPRDCSCLPFPSDPTSSSLYHSAYKIQTTDHFPTPRNTYCLPALCSSPLVAAEEGRRAGPFLSLGFRHPYCPSPTTEPLFLVCLYPGCFILAYTQVFPTPKRVFPPL